MAVNDHLLFVGTDTTFTYVAALYSTDDGQTWTDASASLAAVTGFVFADSNYAMHLATNGDTWLLVDENGMWAGSNDSAVWFGTDDVVNHKNVMLGSDASVDAIVNGCLYAKADDPATPGNQWNRWIVYGRSQSIASPADTSTFRPIVAQAKGKSASPLAVTTDWTRDITLPAGRSTRPMEVIACTHDWYHEKIWFLAFAHDTLRFELWMAADSEYETVSGAFTLIDFTHLLPAELSQRSLRSSYAYQNEVKAAMFFDIGYERMRLLITTAAYTATYERDNGAFSNTPFYRYDFVSANEASWLNILSHTPMASTVGLDGTQWLTGGAWSNAAYVPGPCYEHHLDPDGLAMYPGLRTSAGTFIRAIWADTDYDTTAVVRGATPEDGWAAPITSATLDLMGEVIVAGVAPPSAVDTSATAPVDYYPVLSIVAVAPDFCGHLEVATAAPTAATLTTWLPTLLKWHAVADVVNVTSGMVHNLSCTMLLADAIATSSTVLGAVEYLLTSLASFGDTQTTKLTGGEAVADVLVVLESFLISYPLTLTDSFATIDTVLGTHTFVGILVDAFSLLDGITDRLTAADLLADTIVNACLVAHAPQELMTDSIALASTAAQWATAVGTIIDALVATDTATMSARFVTVCADSVAAGDTLATTLTALESVTDEIALYVTFRIGDEVYRGYVLNTGNKAASEYTNFDFNSLATVDGVTLLANDTALYRLVGDDDDGTAIEAKVRTGLLAVADGKMAQVLAAYVGYASDNSLVLKAIVTSKTGEKVEHWYRLAEQTADATREGRIKLGRGLKSAYWAFEIHNVAGGTMDLDNIKLHRLALDRRI